ncbi:hypothetical protein KFK09_001174 [Dendrobium nobile]|uniref:Uncharacterized protein n=1 Tax=Dendrobium nobile TaxID=94219 RepID=A0A8T3CA38_DENNO|nr:hypothetical protein KFK09_001174 [Dendrobium nobile]
MVKVMKFYNRKINIKNLLQTIKKEVPKKHFYKNIASKHRQKNNFSVKKKLKQTRLQNFFFKFFLFFILPNVSSAMIEVSQ